MEGNKCVDKAEPSKESTSSIPERRLQFFQQVFPTDHISDETSNVESCEMSDTIIDKLFDNAQNKQLDKEICKESKEVTYKTTGMTPIMTLKDISSDTAYQTRNIQPYKVPKETPGHLTDKTLETLFQASEKTQENKKMETQKTSLESTQENVRENVTLKTLFETPNKTHEKKKIYMQNTSSDNTQESIPDQVLVKTQATSETMPSVKKLIKTFDKTNGNLEKRKGNAKNTILKKKPKMTSCITRDSKMNVPNVILYGTVSEASDNELNAPLFMTTEKTLQTIPEKKEKAASEKKLKITSCKIGSKKISERWIRASRNVLDALPHKTSNKSADRLNVPACKVSNNTPDQTLQETPYSTKQEVNLLTKTINKNQNTELGEKSNETYNVVSNKIFENTVTETLKKKSNISSRKTDQTLIITPQVVSENASKLKSVATFFKVPNYIRYKTKVEALSIISDNTPEKVSDITVKDQDEILNKVSLEQPKVLSDNILPEKCVSESCKELDESLQKELKLKPVGTFLKIPKRCQSQGKVWSITKDKVLDTTSNIKTVNGQDEILNKVSLELPKVLSDSILSSGVEDDPNLDTAASHMILKLMSWTSGKTPDKVLSRMSDKISVQTAVVKSNNILNQPIEQRFNMTPKQSDKQPDLKSDEILKEAQSDAGILEKVSSDISDGTQDQTPENISEDILFDPKSIRIFDNSLGSTSYETQKDSSNILSDQILYEPRNMASFKTPDKQSEVQLNQTLSRIAEKKKTGEQLNVLPGNIPDKKLQNISGEKSILASGQISEKSAINTFNEPLDAISSNISQMIQAEMPNKVSVQILDSTAIKKPDIASAKSLNEKLPKIPEEVPKIVSGQISDRNVQNMSGESSNVISDKTQDKISPKTPVCILDKPSNNILQISPVEMSKRASGEMLKIGSGQILDKTAKKKSEESSVAIPVKTSVEMPNTASDPKFNSTAKKKSGHRSCIISVKSLIKAFQKTPDKVSNKALAQKPYIIAKKELSEQLVVISDKTPDNTSQKTSEESLDNVLGQAVDSASKKTSSELSVILSDKKLIETPESALQRSLNKILDKTPDRRSQKTLNESTNIKSERTLDTAVVEILEKTSAETLNAISDMPFDDIADQLLDMKIGTLPSISMEISNTLLDIALDKSPWKTPITTSERHHKIPSMPMFVGDGSSKLPDKMSFKKSHEDKTKYSDKVINIMPAEIPNIISDKAVPGAPEVSGTSGESVTPGVPEPPGAPIAPGAPEALSATEAPGALKALQATGKLGAPEALGALGVPDSPEAEKATEAPGVPERATGTTDAPETLKSTEAPEALRATEAPGAPEALRATEAPGAPEALGATGTLGSPEAVKATVAPGAPEALRATEAPGAPEALGVTGTLGSPEAVKATVPPGAPEALSATEAPGAPEALGVTGTLGSPETVKATVPPGAPEALTATEAPGAPEAMKATEAPGGPEALGTTGAPGAPGTPGTQGITGVPQPNLAEKPPKRWGIVGRRKKPPETLGIKERKEGDKLVEDPGIAYSTNPNDKAAQYGYDVDKNMKLVFDQGDSNPNESEMDLDEEEEEEEPIGWLEQKGFTGFFNDGWRRIDYVLVLVDEDTPDVQNVKSSFLSNIAIQGLEMELERGATVDSEHLVFVKIYAPDSVLMRYHEMFGIRKVFKERHIKYMNAKLKIHKKLGVRYEGDWIDLVRNNYIPWLGYSMLERSYIVYMLLRLLPFGPYQNYIGIERLLKKQIILDAFALHDGPYFFVNEQKLGCLNLRQILFYKWLGIKNTLTFQPLHLINEYLGPKLAFYFAIYETYIWVLIIPAATGIISSLAQFAGSSESNTQMVKRYCETEKTMDHLVCPRCLNFKACPFTFVYEHCPRMAFYKNFDNVWFYFMAWVAIFTGIFFVKFWEYREKYLIWIWDLYRSKTYILRAQYKVDKEVAFSPNTPLHYPANFAVVLKRKTISTLVMVACFWLIVFVTVIGLYLKYVGLDKSSDVRKKMEEDRPSEQGAGFKATALSKYLNKWYMALILYLIAITIFYFLVIELVCKLASRFAVDKENHKTNATYEFSLINKQFSIVAFATIPSLLFFGWFKNSLYTLPHKGWISNLTFPSTKTSLTSKVFGHLIHLNCNPLTCLDEFIIAFIVVFSIRVLLVKVFEFIRFWDRTDYSLSAKDLKRIPAWEREYKLHKVTDYDVIEKYSLLAIEFLLLSWFGAAFPLAPVLALVVNVFHIRREAQTILLSSRRPTLYQRVGIGPWNHVFAIIAYVTPVTLGILVMRVSSLVPQYIYKKIRREYYTKKDQPDYYWRRFATSNYLTISEYMTKTIKAYKFPFDTPLFQHCYFYGFYEAPKKTAAALSFPFDREIRQITFSGISDFRPYDHTYMKSLFDLLVILFFEVIALMLVLLLKHYLGYPTKTDKLRVSEKKLMEMYKHNMRHFEKHYRMSKQKKKCPFSRCRKPLIQCRECNPPYAERGDTSTGLADQPSEVSGITSKSETAAGETERVSGTTASETATKSEATVNRMTSSGTYFVSSTTTTGSTLRSGTTGSESAVISGISASEIWLVSETTNSESENVSRTPSSESGKKIGTIASEPGDLNRMTISERAASETVTKRKAAGSGKVMKSEIASEEAFKNEIFLKSESIASAGKTKSEVTAREAAINSMMAGGEGDIKREVTVSEDTIKSKISASQSVSKSDSITSKGALKREITGNRSAVKIVATASQGVIKTKKSSSKSAKKSKSTISGGAIKSEATVSECAIESEMTESESVTTTKSNTSEDATKSGSTASEGVIKSEVTARKGALKRKIAKSEFSIKFAGTGSEGVIKSKMSPNKSPTKSKSTASEGAVKSKTTVSEGTVKSEITESESARETESTTSKDATKSASTASKCATKSDLTADERALQRASVWNEDAIKIVATASEGALKSKSLTKSKSTASEGAIKNKTTESVSTTTTKSTTSEDSTKSGSTASEGSIKSEVTAGEGAFKREIAENEVAIRIIVTGSEGVIKSRMGPSKSLTKSKSTASEGAIKSKATLSKGARKSKTTESECDTETASTASEDAIKSSSTASEVAIKSVVNAGESVTKRQVSASESATSGSEITKSESLVLIKSVSATKSGSHAIVDAIKNEVNSSESVTKSEVTASESTTQSEASTSEHSIKTN